MVSDSVRRLRSARAGSALIGVAVLCVIIALAYGRTLTMGFVWDDVHQIVNNGSIKKLSGIPSLFSHSVWSHTGDDGSYYRPLFSTSLSLDWVLWEGRAFGFHLTNVVLHALVTLLMYLLLSHALQDRRLALLAAALFAAHPVHSESVGWISARPDLLAALFVAISLLLLLPARDRAVKPVMLMLSAFSFFLSLLCKEVAILLPVFIYYWMAGVAGATRRGALLIVTPYLAMVLIYLGLRAHILSETSLFQKDLLTHLATAPVLVARYFGLTVWPYPLKVFYDLDPQNSLVSPVVLLSWLCLLLLLAALFWMWRSNPRIFGFAMFFPLFIFPVSGFVFFTRPALMAERYLYLPSIGICTVAAWLILSAIARAEGFFNRNRFVDVIGATVIALVMFGMLYKVNMHNEVWRDQTSFIQRLVSDAPESAMGHNAMGVLLFNEGRYEESVAAYSRSIQINPIDCLVIFNRAIAFKRLGQMESALQDLQRTLQCRPEFANAWFELGTLELARGNRERAISCYERAVRIDPTNTKYRVTLGRVR